MRFAFQPIVDTGAWEVYSHEALMRGPNGESPAVIFEGLSAAALIALDHEGWATAIDTAVRLGATARINLNASPGALLAADAISRLEAQVGRSGLRPQDVVIEVTECEAIADRKGFDRTVSHLRTAGFLLAIDDFGAGYAGLNLLANFQPDLLKLDMSLVRGVHWDGPRQAIVRAILSVAVDLGIDVIAEGVETEPEHAWLANEGVRYFQGFLFGRPALERLECPIRHVAPALSSATLVGGMPPAFSRPMDQYPEAGSTSRQHHSGTAQSA